jgi:hypothetical protein
MTLRSKSTKGMASREVRCRVPTSYNQQVWTFTNGHSPVDLDRFLLTAYSFCSGRDRLPSLDY